MSDNLKLRQNGAGFRIFKGANIVQGVSDASFGSITGKRGDKNVARFLKSLGHKDINLKRIVWAKQVFGAKVHICKIKDSGKIIKGADGLISNAKNQVLAIVSADCVPILLYDPKKEVMAALHGSRKSLLKGIIKNAVSKMSLRFGSKPQDILVGIGPHIRKCHYWLKDKAYRQLRNTYFKKYFLKEKDKIYFDLIKLVFDELLSLGIKRKNIEDCQICTFCQFKRYFSARKEEEPPKIYPQKNPRFAAFISLRDSQVLSLSSKKLGNYVKEAVLCIKKGGVMVCPTDTVYGLVADASNKKAVERLFKIKKRSLGKHIPIFVKDFKAAKKLAHISKKQEKFLKEVWPGSVTAILKRKKKQKIYGVDRKTIGLRIPKYKLILELLKETNKPLTGTSANIVGKPASTRIEEVIKQFMSKKYQPDLIISAGNLPKSKPSKVIDLTGEKMIILRR